MAVFYSRIAGDFPPGLSMSLAGRITGTPPAQTPPPTWLTVPSELPEMVAGQPTSFTFTASSTAGQAITRFQSVGEGILPPGLTLDSRTGVLSGNPAYDTQNRDFSPSEAPVWDTNNDTEMAVDEGQDFEMTLRAAPVRGDSLRYSLLEAYGDLPSGITLHPITGVLSGKAPEQAGAVENDPTKLVWDTPAGLLGSAYEFESFTTTLSAASVKNQTVRYALADESSLPAGLVLNPVTGVISGTLAEFRSESEPVVKVPLPPIWNTPADLGTVRSGTTVAMALSASPSAGRAISRFYLVTNSTLPTGIRIGTIDGLLQGMAPAVSQDTLTNIAVIAEDDSGATARRDFIMTITP